MGPRKLYNVANFYFIDFVAFAGCGKMWNFLFVPVWGERPRFLLPSRSSFFI